MSPPLVSIVIATYNRAYCVGNAIDSALAQTYHDFEVIVVDDGSTDNTPEVLERYGDRIRVIRQENLSQPVARNVGNEAAHGDLIVVLDSDDIIPANRVEISVALFEKYPDAAMIFGGFETVDDDGRVTYSHDFSNPNDSCYLPPSQRDAQVEACYAACLRGGPGFCIHPTNAYRKEAIVEVGGYDPSFKCALDIKLRMVMGRRWPFAYTRHCLCTVTRGRAERMSSSCERTVPNVLRIYQAERDYVIAERAHDADRLIAIIERKVVEMWRDLAEERIDRGDRRGAREALSHVAWRHRDLEWWRLWYRARLPKPVVSLVGWANNLRHPAQSDG